jgi:hypothetical protein
LPQTLADRTTSSIRLRTESGSKSAALLNFFEGQDAKKVRDKHGKRDWGTPPW